MIVSTASSGNGHYKYIIGARFVSRPGPGESTGKNPFNGVDVGHYAKPACFDMDGE